MAGFRGECERILRTIYIPSSHNKGKPTVKSGEAQYIDPARRISPSICEACITGVLEIWRPRVYKVPSKIKSEMREASIPADPRFGGPELEPGGPGHGNRVEGMGTNLTQSNQEETPFQRERTSLKFKSVHRVIRREYGEGKARGEDGSRQEVRVAKHCHIDLRHQPGTMAIDHGPYEARRGARGRLDMDQSSRLTSPRHSHRLGPAEVSRNHVAYPPPECKSTPESAAELGLSKLGHGHVPSFLQCPCIWKLEHIDTIKLLPHSDQSGCTDPESAASPRPSVDKCPQVRSQIRPAPSNLPHPNTYTSVTKRS
ncbi:hypothetical protein K438DRAFT_1750425 [Mycena galopus ATCC 62051]|nr:hypothetical protein K438DRAFT_1750425 [Mycena galopus ATCC 62051]